MHLIAAKRGYEAYIQYDESGGVWEVFADTGPETYLGCADDRAAAAKIGKDWVEEQAAGN
jgi:hypothetical protein